VLVVVGHGKGHAAVGLQRGHGAARGGGGVCRDEGCARGCFVCGAALIARCGRVAARAPHDATGRPAHSTPVARRPSRAHSPAGPQQDPGEPPWTCSQLLSCAWAALLGAALFRTAATPGASATASFACLVLVYHRQLRQRDLDDSTTRRPPLHAVHCMAR
jgi:hypothetical protein